MRTAQRDHNPDVNSYVPDVGPAESPGATDGGNRGAEDVERPVPPDSTPAAPVEEPPESDGSPVGDVDDSPKRIA